MTIFYDSILEATGSEILAILLGALATIWAGVLVLVCWPLSARALMKDL